MSVEQKILITLLKLTRSDPTTAKIVASTAGIPTNMVESFLQEYASNNLVKYNRQILEASLDQRIRIATRAIKLGSDFERVCRLLEWKEFERIATIAFKAFNYDVKKNFRFKMKNKKRWEIDLLAFSRPIIASVDCKRWTQNWSKVNIIRIVERHVERTKSLAISLQNLSIKTKLKDWKQVTIIPIVLSLLAPPLKFHNNTPIVPVLRLQSFLNEMPAHMTSLTHFKQKINMIDKKITEY